MSTDAAALGRALVDFYGPLTTSPDAARRVGWESAGAHRLRLAAIDGAIAGALALEPAASVLDVGAGEGALVGVLRARGFAGAYRGEDVLASMVAAARRAHPAETFEVVADGFDAAASALPRATAVVCSGALNTRVVADHDAWVARALTALWARAEAIVAVDLAVADRHPPGVGIALADLPRAWAVARKLAPVVVVREDVLPGEALIIMQRSRAAPWRAWSPDATARAELLLTAGEPAVALALAAADDASLRGRALFALGRIEDAESALAEVASPTDVDVVARAQIAWRTGRKAACEALLRDLAARSDEGRAQLVALLLGRGRVEEARALCAAIVDPWIRRELDARLPKR